MTPTVLGWTPDEWIALGTCVTAVVAAIAAGFAGWQLIEVRRTRHDQTQPFVVVDIVPPIVSHMWLALVIENIGKTLARDVVITFDPALTVALSDSKLVGGVMLTKGIASLPPGRRIEVLFDTFNERMAADLPMQMQATVDFKDARGRKQDALTYDIDLDVLIGLELTGERTVHHAAAALEDLSKTIKGWSDSRRLRVTVHDEQAEQQHARVVEGITGQRPSFRRSVPSDLWMALGDSPIARPLVGRIYRAREARRSRSG